jgi:hypothetical protein
VAQGDVTVTVVGNLTNDPELRFTPSGAAVANFTVASTPRLLDKATNEWKDGDALFMRCSIWRQAAENVAESLQRGARVIVTALAEVRHRKGRQGPAQRRSVLGRGTVVRRTVLIVVGFRAQRRSVGDPALVVGQLFRRAPLLVPFPPDHPLVREGLAPTGAPRWQSLFCAR